MPAWVKRNPEWLLIRPHPCMGDHIICNGLYRVMAKRWKRVTVLALSKNALFVRQMLSDTPIEIVEVGREWDMDDYCNRVGGLPTILRLGFASEEPFDRWQFDRDWYRQAGVPFDARFAAFSVPPCPQVAPPKGFYVFVHDRPDMCNAKLPTFANEVRPTNEHPIFYYRDVIKAAAELHCVSSRFAAFADSLDLGGKPCFFYSFGREIPTHMNKWEYIN